MMLTCGCKGIRTCKLCETAVVHVPANACNGFTNLKFCRTCSRAYFMHSDCASHSDGFEFTDVTILENFISNIEEDTLVATIDESPWLESQSGRRKQDYGVKVNFKKKKIKIGSFTGLPSYSRSLVKRLHERMRNKGLFDDFFPVELCNLEYLPERGSSIVPHLDDSWLWGERLVLLNLVSETRMMFTLPQQGRSNPEAYADEMQRYKLFAHSHLSESEAALPPRISVDLPPRSLLLMQGVARHIWFHEINRDDILMRRLSLTLRELAYEFIPPKIYLQPFLDATSPSTNSQTVSKDQYPITEHQQLGLNVIQLAASYSGVCVAVTLAAQLNKISVDATSKIIT